MLFLFKTWNCILFTKTWTFFTATLQEASWDVHVLCQIATKRLQKPLSGHFSMWVHTACVCVGLRNVFMISWTFIPFFFVTDDTTRVVLKGTDDYINANFINVSVHHWLWLFKLFCQCFVLRKLSSVYICVFRWKSQVKVK